MSLLFMGTSNVRFYRSGHQTAQELRSVLIALGGIGDHSLAKSVQRFALRFQRVIEVEFSLLKLFPPVNPTHISVPHKGYAMNTNKERALKVTALLF